ncbi:MULTISPECIES: ABC transporter ATP-binding protein [unclassified Sphingomonas]|uniref:ABC transporter ATP-binding protein n=1 Tax=unclassified Sphingomonas TaxID=196159 RepID=UPI0006FF3E7A|nr:MULTISPECIES: ABC transporter ATP-binding protein [unclassified Sphingomonas]KQM65437.1 multidrug ABC transporter ATP-binding protein [Sphingomonas sp. Leaf16]KQN17039.1 multidrug ABC transporter ATP-binding protein [Sphingomonas sp. Leaf32]KQN17212.1 multidrug ABC transporter ATP-binding protein [Sphingomonas sp. Leaf29]
METILSIRGIAKTYTSGTVALQPTDLDIAKGEIFALLGPNGAGKTTLISIICGIVTPSAGTVTAAGFDTVSDYRETRTRIGLVPQELLTDAFETVMATVTFSRRLFGRHGDPVFIEKLLRDLTLWDKRDAKMTELSGGMKRRVMIAKALSHEPDILFLDEPTAGVDVELRRDMWRLVHDLRERGVTIILTTHYIEEAEEMADRVGVIAKGRLILVEEKAALMRKLGKKTLTLTLSEPMESVPAALSHWPLTLADEGHALTFAFDAKAEDNGVRALLRAVDEAGIGWKDIATKQSSLEDIFVGLVHEEESRA